MHHAPGHGTPVYVDFLNGPDIAALAITDAELIAAIPKLHDGADKLRRGAARMRSEGEKMRRGG